ncbi:MFS transporter [Kutzneria buriramensis]|uniref:Putative MFS family arabinose efflux permease n=1 Tax=Kutzneria buriramensis TaxID=1045776 RepID=A0A3E0H255_9PSEU|nr:MFS transporter [Kutzneria buriramensis]REH36344.1 putative MFS family arabinose efflux permease [Kutzneria buriramensis]
MTATLWRNGDYLLYWWSRASSILGSQVSYLAIPLYALTVLHQSPTAALVGVCGYGSGLLFALHAGVIGDRFDRRLVMVAADVCRAVLMGILAMQAAFGVASLLSMCLIALAVGALSVVFDSAANAALPDLVGEELFARAMARNQSRDFALGMAGPLLGGALVAVGPKWAFAFDAASYVVSAILLVFIRTPLAPGAGPGRRRTLAMIRDGLGWVVKDRTLRRMTLYLSVLNLVLTAGVFATADHFVARAEPLGQGFMVAVQAVGGLLGSLVAERLHRTRSVRAIIGLHGGLWFVGLTAAGILPVAPVIAFGFGIGWLVAPALRIAFGSRLVRVVPTDVRGRVNSAVSLSTATFSMVGPAVGGVAFGLVGYGVTMVGLGLVALAAVLLAPRSTVD